MSDGADSRMTRIEERMDTIQDAIVTLARIEERQQAQLEEARRTGERIEALESRMRVMELAGKGHGLVAGGAVQLVWTLLSAAIGAAVAWVTSSGGKH